MARSALVIATTLLLVGALPGAAADTPLPVTVNDHDDDGHDEIEGDLHTGFACACHCPVMGGGVAVAAAGQRAHATTWTVLPYPVCGLGADAHADPADVDPQARNTVTPHVVCYEGGLGSAVAFCSLA